MRWWTPQPTDIPAMAWYEPLVAVSRRARADHVIWPVFIDDFEFFGRVERSKRPAISVYGHLATGRELLADERGRTYEMIRVASERAPCRFKQIDLTAAIWRCGLPDHVDATLEPRPGAVADDGGDGEVHAREPHLRLLRGGAA
jgi:hypothetical protein